MYKSLVLIYCYSSTRSQINYSKNYYKILQLSLTCDQKSIKKSYLQLVKKLHPDVNPNGKQQFTEVQQAFQVLSNDKLKKQYDQNRNLYNHVNNSNNNNSQYKPNSQYQYKNQDNNNHGYYTHRTYNSDNYQDYFYDNPKPNYNNNNKKYNRQKYQQNEQQQQQINRTRQKHQNTKQQWQKYKQQNKSSRYQHQTQQQRNIRDKLHAMRGFTSSHNVMWNRQHLRYKTLMNQHNQKNQNQQIINKVVPDKIKKFYDKIMTKVVKHITDN